MRRSRCRTVAVAALSWLLLMPASEFVRAADPLDPVTWSMTVLPDVEGTFTADDVLRGAHDALALPGTAGPRNLGYPHHPYWARIVVHNRGERTVQRELVLWRGAAHGQQAFELFGGTVVPLRYATHDSRHSMLPFELAPNQRRELAVRVDSTTALSLDFRLLDAHALADIDRVDYWVFGLVAGIVLAIAIYVFALYFAMRDTLYLHFALFSALNLVYQLHSESYAYLLWGQEGLWAGSLLAAYSGAGFCMFLVQFIRKFAEVDVRLPRYDRWLMLPSLALLASVFPLFLVRPWLGNTMAAISVSLVAVVCCVAVLLGATRRRTAWPLVFGVVLFSTAGMVHLLRRIGVLPDTQALNMLLQLGSAVLVISFGIAVMMRIRRVVTENQEAQARYAQQLEVEVGERTAELQKAKDAAEQALSSLQQTQQQLVQSEKMASLGQLVAGVAHEVNTPLGVALTASTYLEERAHTVTGHMQEGKLTRVELSEFLGDTEHSAGMIERNLSRAAHLVATFKQVSVDRTSDGRRVFRLDAYIRDLAESLELTWKRRPIRLEIECPPGIEMDSFPGALGQVLTNLIQNALIHAYPGERGGLMRLVVSRLDDERIGMSFTDDGAGVPADQLPRIFDPFYTTRRNQGGTGLGLHVTWNLVAQKLGGSIRAESHEGRGLALHIELPRVAPSESGRPDRG